MGGALVGLAAGAISAVIVGAAAWNLHSEAQTAQEREQKQAAIEAMERERWGDPETWTIPELYVIEPYDPENANAPS